MPQAVCVSAEPPGSFALPLLTPGEGLFSPELQGSGLFQMDLLFISCCASFCSHGFCKQSVCKNHRLSWLSWAGAAVTPGAHPQQPQLGTGDREREGGKEGAGGRGAGEKLMRVRADSGPTLKVGFIWDSHFS